MQPKLILNISPWKHCPRQWDRLNSKSKASHQSNLQNWQSQGRTNGYNVLLNYQKHQSLTPLVDLISTCPSTCLANNCKTAYSFETWGSQFWNLRIWIQKFKFLIWASLNNPSSKQPINSCPKGRQRLKPGFHLDRLSLWEQLINSKLTKQSTYLATMRKRLFQSELRT